MTVRGSAPRRIHLAALPHSGPRADGGRTHVSRPAGRGPGGRAAPADAAGPARRPVAGASPLPAFAAFERSARTAERGLFDFLFLTGGGPLPGGPANRHAGTEAVARPEPVTALSALAAVTERLGLAATADATSHAPYELARRLATLDHLSGGRAAWHLVTSVDAVTGGNFRRGSRPGRADRYARAAEFVAAARAAWDSWPPDGEPRPFAHRGRHFDLAGEFTVPGSPQGHPVVIQAAHSDEGRELAAATADVLCWGRGFGGRGPAGPGTRPGALEAGRAYYADVKRRLAKYGRAPDDLKIMPGVGIVLGDSAAEAREKAAGTAPRPVPARRTGHAPRVAADPGPAPGGAEADEPSCFVGTPETVAAALDAFVRRNAADGFVLVPHPASGGLDEFVDRVVPLLQERGAFRTEYRGSTLRSHLGLATPARKDR
ncbi:LLM class flavin-dependent oxidoreductase [Streptomyces sp. NPDC002514]|uniref:LLM class flavin-dependent oxidoreductase n=1 Tax=Streptomyces sp. NPDC001270 TaxID=3364554 RepID=UPI0036BF4716